MVRTAVFAEDLTPQGVRSPIVSFMPGVCIILLFPELPGSEL
jgi:hypothetical protein